MDAILSVLIPCYNSGNAVGAAIHSLLNQSYTHFEVVVLDDGSTDNTPEVLASFTNPKVIVLKHDKNMGIAAARNTLLNHSKAKYIAWLDADDIALPGRLDKQVEFMESNPKVDLAGSWVMLRNSTKKYKKLPVVSTIIHRRLLIKNCLIQSSIISKNFYLEEGIFYNAEYNYLEDFELWSRLIKSKTIANIPLYLTSYFVPSAENEKAKREKYFFYSKLEKILNQNLISIEINANVNQLKTLTEFSSGQRPGNQKDFEQIFDKIGKKREMKSTIKQLSLEYFAIAKSFGSFLYYLKTRLL